MKHQLLFFIIFMAIACVFPALAAPESTIPKGGTIFIGEQNLDISQCNVHGGDEIGWWESGNPQGVPTARTKVGDTSRFSVTPEVFKGHTGTWYDMVGQKPVFTVEDPSIELEVVENGLGDDKTWVKRGNMVSFKISTNMNAMSKRPGCSGVLVSIDMKGPNGTAPKTVASSKNTEFDLSKIYVYSSPYDTGAAWDTSDETKYPDGKYTFSAKTNTNLIYDNYKESGKTYSDDQTITLSKIKEKEEKNDTKSDKTDEKPDKSDKVSASSVKSDTTDSEVKVKSSLKVTEEPTDEPTKKPTAEETVEKSSKSSKSSSSSKVTDEPTDEPTKKPTAEETVEKSPKSSKSSSSSKVTDEPTDEPTKKPTAEEKVEKSSKSSKSTSSSKVTDEPTDEPTKKPATDDSDGKSTKKETITGIASFGNEPEGNTSKTEVTEKPTSRQTLTVTTVPTTAVTTRTPTPQETGVKGTQAKPAVNKSSYPHPPKTTQKAQPLSPVVAAGALMLIAVLFWVRRD